MTIRAGLWIDQREAVIVRLSDGEQVTSVVYSDASRNSHPAEGDDTSRPPQTRQGSIEDVRDRRHENQLDLYYDAIVAHVHDAEAILVLGPGEAKIALRTVLEREGLGARIVDVESADKMTVPQIVAKVRERFQSAPERR